MQNKPILIGFASAILILVVAAASFSAGLYLGQRGYVADLQSQPQNSGLPAGNSPQSGPLAGQPNPGGLNPQGGPPNAPSWPPDTMGRLLSLTATEIVLDTPQGQVTVAVASSTTFINEAGMEMPSSELKPGDVVAIFGKDVAATIMRLPARPNVP
jgi:hypothetical protein